MGVAYNTSIVRNGLALHLDAANVKSYPGSGTTWTDLSGNGKDGTLVNGVGYSSDNKGTMVFDGTNDYVDAGIFAFERTDPFTFESFINCSNIGIKTHNIISNIDSNRRGYQYSVTTSGSLSLELVSTNFTSEIDVRVTGSDLLPNTWYHVVATYTGNSNSSGVKMYINSVSQTLLVNRNTLSSTIVNSQTTWIGRRVPLEQNTITGNISNVKIYNRALSDLEVQQNFESLRGRYGI